MIPKRDSGIPRRGSMPGKDLPVQIRDKLRWDPRGLFQDIDVDLDGIISPKEVVRFLERSKRRFSLTGPVATEIKVFQEMDMEGNTELTLQDFLCALKTIPGFDQIVTEPLSRPGSPRFFIPTRAAPLSPAPTPAPLSPAPARAPLSPEPAPAAPPPGKVNPAPYY